MDDLARQQGVYDVLEQLGIRYDRFDHPAVATVDEAVAHWAGIDAAHCKNLFLRNRKGDRHYLIVVDHRKQANLRVLAVRLGDDRLSFASPERLDTHLGLSPGAVSPFGLVNDVAQKVRLVMDADLKAASFLAFHPNVNTVTLRIARVDFERFVASTGHTIQWAVI